jgi:PilZ domain
MQHRCGERVGLRRPVRLRRDGWDSAGILTNISVSGGFVRTRLQVPVMSMVRVAVGELEVQGYVVRRTAEGVGIEWCDFAPAPICKLVMPEDRVERPVEPAPVPLAQSA